MRRTLAGHRRCGRLTTVQKQQVIEEVFVRFWA